VWSLSREFITARVLKREVPAIFGNSHNHDKERAVGKKRQKQRLSVIAGSIGLVIDSNTYTIAPFAAGGWGFNFSGNTNAFCTLTFCSSWEAMPNE
jgi:hypothetical protein